MMKRQENIMQSPLNQESSDMHYFKKRFHQIFQDWDHLLQYGIDKREQNKLISELLETFYDVPPT